MKTKHFRNGLGLEAGVRFRVKVSQRLGLGLGLSWLRLG